MALSHEVVSQFAKLVDNQPKKDEGVTVKGTYKKIGNIEYVQLDGSDVLTPVESTVEAKTGERVQVLIKDHFATVTGNISSPAARSKDVKDLADTVDEQGNTIQQIDNTIIQQGNSIIQMNTSINQHETTINQHETKINQQGDQIVSINNTVIAQGNSIEANHNAIIAQGNEIDSMNNTITSHGNSITSMNNTLQQHDNKITQNSNAITQQGNTITQQGNKITEIDNTVQTQGNTIVAQGNTIDAHGTQLTTHNSQITILNSGFVIQDGVLTGLSGAILNSLKTNVLNAEYAKIDFANINMAAVTKLFTESGIIKDLIVEEGAITGELVGVTIKGDLIEANTLIADRIVVKGSNGLYYRLNTLGETEESEQTYNNSLNGSVIAAKSITASKIQVTDLVAFGATIGGFTITDHSIHSQMKPNLDSPMDGLYLGDDGQVALGNDRNHIKYYKDSNDQYVLDVRLDKLYLGSSTETADKQLESLVEISAENISSTFRSTGGSNLIKNSVGYKGTDFWVISDPINAIIETKQDNNMSSSGSEFIFKNACYIQQNIDVQLGTEYSISFKYKHKAIGTPNNVKVEILGNDEPIVLLNSNVESSQWISKTLLDEDNKPTTFKPTNNVNIIKITNVGDDEFEITDLIISRGITDVWSGYRDEIYGKQHKLDEKGLILKDEGDDSYYYSDTKATGYHLKHHQAGTSTINDSIVGELTRDRVYSQLGEFDKGIKTGKLHTAVIDTNNIIEYIDD